MGIGFKGISLFSRITSRLFLCLSIARPTKPAIAQARDRRIPLFAFRHHQHLLDHLQQHIEQSPSLTETGEADLGEQQNADNNGKPPRRSHYTVQ